MVTIEKRLTPYNFTEGPAAGREIKYIVIHYFGALGTARNVADYFAGAYRGASAHYAVDEDPVIWQSVEDKDISWHCGSSIYYHPECRNTNSIGIEVRPYKLDESTASSAAAQDWYFSEAVIRNLFELTKHLMRKYGIPPDRVIRHYDVTHKWCPRPFMGDDINVHYGTSGNTQWERFKTRLTEEMEEENMVRYERLADIPDNWDAEGNPRATVRKLMEADILRGDGGGIIDLSHDMLRTIILEYRGGAFDRALIAAGLEPAVKST